jgi:hypothetical protein
MNANKTKSLTMSVLFPVAITLILTASIIWACTSSKPTCSVEYRWVMTQQCTAGGLSCECSDTYAEEYQSHETKSCGHWYYVCVHSGDANAIIARSYDCSGSTTFDANNHCQPNECQHINLVETPGKTGTGWHCEWWP